MFEKSVSFSLTCSVEQKRKLLVIAPSSLRKQSNQGLVDTFFLPSMTLETKPFNQEIKRIN